MLLTHSTGIGIVSADFEDARDCDDLRSQLVVRQQDALTLNTVVIHYNVMLYI
jgi:hypothetical protein